jgi:hypothetical protein
MAAMPADVGESEHGSFGVTCQENGFGSVIERSKLAGRQQVFSPTETYPATRKDVLGFPIENLLGPIGLGREGAAVAKWTQEVLDGCLVNGRG